MQSAEDVARLVFKFVEAAGSLVDGLDKDEEVRLLRVRTRKNELLIVPSRWHRFRAIEGGFMLIATYRCQVPARRYTRYATCLSV